MKEIDMEEGRQHNWAFSNPETAMLKKLNNIRVISEESRKFGINTNAFSKAHEY
jgi:hypothetical protein